MHAHHADQIPSKDAVLTGTPTETIQAELLHLCEEFFRTASSTVHTELRQFLNTKGYNPHTSQGWFLDSLAFTAGNLPERQ